VKFIPMKSVVPIGLVLLGLMLGSCKEESSQSRRDSVRLDYSQLAAAFTESRTLLTEDLLALVPGDIELLQFRTYLEETGLFLKEKKAQTQVEIDDVLKWLNNLTEDTKEWEPEEIPPPWPLVECGNTAIAAPEVVSSFVVTEYFGLGACVWHGNLYPGEILIETREGFAKKDPALDEILRRYFIDDEWRCTQQ